MNKINSIETQSHLDAIPLSDQTKFRLNEINKIKDYFNSEIQERKTMSKKLSKYIAAFDYIDKTLIVSCATSGGINFFCKCYWSSCRISKCKFYSCIFFNHRNNKKIIESNKEKSKNTIKLLYLLKDN